MGCPNNASSTAIAKHQYEFCGANGVTFESLCEQMFRLPETFQRKRIYYGDNHPQRGFEIAGTIKRVSVAPGMPGEKIAVRCAIMEARLPGSDTHPNLTCSSILYGATLVLVANGGRSTLWFEKSTSDGKTSILLPFVVPERRFLRFERR